MPINSRNSINLSKIINGANLFLLSVVVWSLVAQGDMVTRFFVLTMLFAYRHEMNVMRFAGHDCGEDMYSEVYASISVGIVVFMFFNVVNPYLGIKSGWDISIALAVSTYMLYSDFEAIEEHEHCDRRKVDVMGWKEVWQEIKALQDTK